MGYLQPTAVDATLNEFTSFVVVLYKGDISECCYLNNFMILIQQTSYKLEGARASTVYVWM